jgi:hypothetical protein
MRQQLAAHSGERLSFTATFERLGWKQTVLPRDICFNNGHLVAGHLWFNLTKGFEALGLKAGDRLSFDARVTTYRKGRASEGQRWGYRLSHPTKAARVAEADKAGGRG